jgi:hypothetical protein
MNVEILEKAKEINAEIEKIKTAIDNISYHHKRADKNQPYKKYNWMIRVFNKKTENGATEAKMFLFDNNDIHGSDIPIDEELLIVIKEYFESKLKEKEQQFNELN